MAATRPDGGRQEDDKRVRVNPSIGFGDFNLRQIMGPPKWESTYAIVGVGDRNRYLLEQTRIHKHSISSFFFAVASSVIFTRLAHHRPPHTSPPPPPLLTLLSTSTTVARLHDTRPVCSSPPNVAFNVASSSSICTTGSRRAADQSAGHPVHSKVVSPAALAISSSAAPHTEAEVARE